MEAIIITTLIVGTFYLLMRRIRKVRNAPESKLSIYDHPSTFVKPDIEMVTTSQPKDNNDDSNLTMDFQTQKPD